MNRVQMIALWIATVSLVVVAVFTTLDYFDEPEAAEPSPMQPFQWEGAEAWACVNAYTAVLSNEGRSFDAIEDGTVVTRSDVFDLLEQLLLDCTERFSPLDP